MVVTKDISFPSEEELTVEEVELTSAALRAGSFHFGKYCEQQNNEFVLCREELNDPRQCVNEGKDVTRCALEFFRLVKGSCEKEFTNYATCLDKSSSLLEFQHCRKTQAVFDKCVQDNLGLERPPYGYFCRAKVHETARPKPEEPKPAVYPDATPFLPEDYPRPPAKYGSRFHFLN